jgi:diamine N-acetyltransferase
VSATIHNAVERDADVIAGIISRAFADVALRFSLTRENCPKHPSNCTGEWVRHDQERGVRYYIAERDGLPVGCVAMEKANAETCFLERLAVLPDRRRCGIGRALVDHVLRSAQATGVHRVSLSIIVEHAELREWYGRLGFQEGATRNFPHLPFEVLFMEMEIGGNANQRMHRTPR